MSETVKGIDDERVTGWFTEHVDGVQPPLSYHLIAGGRSNLTFKVDDAAGHEYVLRRPPLGHVLATAHDMSREHRIMAALAPTDVPVPPVLGLCTDESVNEAPFYVMRYVDGLVLRSTAEARSLDPEVRAAASRSIATTLAAIHAVDPDEVGLGDLGRREGYIARQLKRWNGQYEQSPREVPVVGEAYQRLAAHVPEQRSVAIVHGDYRLDNCMLDADGNVIAVLDWEICTLGDPLADLGLLMVYWSEPGDPFEALAGSATVLDGFAGRDEMISRYEAAGGIDVGNIDYYVAFGYWKLACILEGVYTRYQEGAMGEDGVDSTGFGQVVEVLGQAAISSLDRAGLA